MGGRGGGKQEGRWAKISCRKYVLFNFTTFSVFTIVEKFARMVKLWKEYWCGNEVGVEYTSNYKHSK